MRKILLVLLLVLIVPIQASAECTFPNCPVYLMAISNGIYWYFCRCCPGTTTGLGQSNNAQSGVPCCQDGECTCPVLPAFARRSGRRLVAESTPLIIAHPHGRIQWIPNTRQPTLPNEAAAVLVLKHPSVTISDSEIVEVTKGTAQPVYFKVFTILHQGKFNYQIGLQIQKPESGKFRIAEYMEQRTYCHKIAITEVNKPYLVSSFDAL